MEEPSRRVARGPLEVEEARAGASERGIVHWTLLGLALLLPLAVVVGARLVEPDPRGFGTHEALGLEPCGVLARFGVPCPGCGVTTAVVLAGRGRLVEAWWTQPLGAALALGTLAVAGWALLESWRGRDLRERLERLRWWRLGLPLGLAAGAAWIYKIVALRHGG